MIIIHQHRWPKKEITRRKLYKKFEIRKLVLKSLLSSFIYNWYYKLYFSHLFYKSPIDSSTSRYRTFCVLILHSRSIFKFFKLSRHSLKYYISNGFITGFRKSSF